MGLYEWAAAHDLDPDDPDTVAAYEEAVADGFAELAIAAEEWEASYGR